MTNEPIYTEQQLDRIYYDCDTGRYYSLRSLIVLYQQGMLRWEHNFHVCANRYYNTCVRLRMDGVDIHNIKKDPQGGVRVRITENVTIFEQVRAHVDALW